MRPDHSDNITSGTEQQERSPILLHEKRTPPTEPQLNWSHDDFSTAQNRTFMLNSQRSQEDCAAEERCAR